MTERHIIEQQRTEINRLYNRIEGYKAALEEIRQRAGAVCNRYEICKHAACAASHGAWELADKAMKRGE